LRSLLATRQFLQADGYLFYGGNLGSTTFAYTSGLSNLRGEGRTYLSGGIVGPFFNRKDNKAKITQSRGTQVDQLVFDILPGESTVFGMTWQQAFRWGYFDGCNVKINRFYMPIGSYGDTRRGSLLMFDGTIGESDCGRSVITIQVNSHKILLNNP